MYFNKCNPIIPGENIKDLSTYSQLVSLRKPDTLKNLTSRNFDMNGDIPPCAPFTKLIIL